MGKQDRFTDEFKREAVAQVVDQPRARNAMGVGARTVVAVRAQCSQ